MNVYNRAVSAGRLMIEYIDFVQRVGQACMGFVGLET
jgi:hypothetical protein